MRRRAGQLRQHIVGRVASSGAVDPLDLVDVELTGGERRLLDTGLGQWGGPARLTEQLAIAMGFAGQADFFAQSERLSEALRDSQALSRLDWTRILLATEIAFASDVVGAGVEWQTVVGWSDEETISVLRQVQRKLLSADAIASDAL